jgi:hypothetical protein
MVSNSGPLLQEVNPIFTRKTLTNSAIFRLNLLLQILEPEFAPILPEMEDF